MTTGGDSGPAGVGPTGAGGAMREPGDPARPITGTTGGSITTGPTGPTGPTGRHAAPTVPAQYSPSATDHPDVLREVPPPPPALPRDGVRWGPVWAGALITLATYLVLQLLFFALGVLDLGFGGGPGVAATTVVSGVLALVAFFVGGLVAGAAGLWTGRKEGVLQGVTVWALTVVGILAIALVGGGALLGSAADAAVQVTGPRPAGTDSVELVRTARTTAGWSALGLGLSLLAAALGGMAGSRARPRDDRAATRR